MASSLRAPGHEHIPRYPSGCITMRILQLVVAVATLGLCSYLVTTSIIGAGFYVQIFTAVCTIIISSWLISAHACSPRAFNYWAVLVLDIYQFLLWLGGFAACAILAVGLFAGHSLDRGGGYYDFNYLRRRYWYRDSYTMTDAAIGAAAAGLGAVDLFFFICLVVDSVVIHRHRRDGLHSRPVRHITASVVMMPPPQPGTTYQAGPQNGMQFSQQETAYNPQSMYGAPQQQQQGFYGQGYAQPQQTGYYAPTPVVPQHTGTSYHKTVSPVSTQQGMAYPPPQQQQQHNVQY
ncbi:hypothetical protein A9K55_002872 [Cordyceps militaris]|uniref:MARVEL domain-containing protein n=1 Tax=Cordyceps militaris TaxID=73501 RepID=A0A2H4S785_CORMI|nr:hypothetical protein A9K55_002872 [Cordyceps militaris]